ncbi:MAG: hypothetical protein KDA81_22830, partial [Planctomycetaceae bacterium]|nr:hypothetical protein [Planctomycetaceae bacterium]
MTGEVVQDRNRFPLLVIEPEQADLGIDRTDFRNFFVGRNRISMSAIDFTTALQFETSVLRDPVLVTDTRTNLDRDHPRAGLLDRLDGSLGHVLADDAVTV